MNAWLETSIKQSEFKRAKNNRILVGHVGLSASHVIAEHEFESLVDFEAAISGMATPEFKKHSESIAPFIVPGSQHWEILRVAA